MCFNKKVVAALAIAGLGIYLFAPNVFGAALPLLILAACPLSMIVMMRMMPGSGDRSCASEKGQTDDELSQLRAEVERLRADQRTSSGRAPETHQFN
jgi:hypothetical protein